MTREEFEILDEWVFINVKHNRDSYSRAKIIEMIMHRAEELVNENNGIHDISYCAEQTKNVLTNKFCNIAKEHAGETFDKVPEATDILKAIDVIEKHCS